MAECSLLHMVMQQANQCLPTVSYICPFISTRWGLTATISKLLFPTTKLCCKQTWADVKKTHLKQAHLLFKLNPLHNSPTNCLHPGGANRHKTYISTDRHWQDIVHDLIYVIIMWLLFPMWLTVVLMYTMLFVLALQTEGPLYPYKFCGIALITHNK